MKPSKNLSKQEIQDKIKETFSKPNLTKQEIRKIKILAMSKNIKLGNYKKLFCKKCNSFYVSNNYEIRIKKPFKVIRCKECNNTSRYKMK